MLLDCIWEGPPAFSAQLQCPGIVLPPGVGFPPLGLHLFIVSGIGLPSCLPLCISSGLHPHHPPLLSYFRGPPAWSSPLYCPGDRFPHWPSPLYCLGFAIHTFPRLVILSWRVSKMFFTPLLPQHVKGGL